MRLFNTHAKRQVQCLDGAWRFAVDRDRDGVRNGWHKEFPTSDTVIVPSCWNCQLGLLDYEGVCWYQRDFFTDGGTVRFVFGAVMTEARVYLDGEEVGYHYGGFCEFEVIVRDLAAGKHNLTLSVDNSFDAKSIPQPVVDWYHYGGITRSVYAERLEGVCILENRFEYELTEALDAAEARFALELYNASEQSLTDTVTATVAGHEFSATVTLAAGERAEVLTEWQTIASPTLWQPDAPKLYEVEISSATDDMLDRIGFRRVEVRDCKLLLNGEPYEIRGVNRHEDHPEYGLAFPPCAYAPRY